MESGILADDSQNYQILVLYMHFMLAICRHQFYVNYAQKSHYFMQIVFVQDYTTWYKSFVCFTCYIERCLFCIGLNKNHSGTT